MHEVRLMLIGGFLGAGKTTLLAEAARRLTARGLRVGVITNDQAPGLVDTALLHQRGLAVREVAGACFCCDFQGLLDAADSLGHSVQADVLLAEPVGSCTDLAATILEPLASRYPDRFTLGPLCVLADPHRLREVLAGETGPLSRGSAYIYARQLDEADRVVITKADDLAPEALPPLIEALRERLGDRPIDLLSARTGVGVDAWLNSALTTVRAGGRVADVDYDIYAAGEAAMGWLNATVALRAAGPQEPSTGDADDAPTPRAAGAWHAMAMDLLESIRRSAEAARATVGHVKLMLSGPGGACAANLVSARRPATRQGGFTRPAARATMLLNARVEMSPQALQQAVHEAIDSATATRFIATIESLQAFSPARPEPTFRSGRDYV